MSYGELPDTGLYVVLSIVVVLAAILTTKIADVRKRNSKDWMEDSVRLKRFATWLLWIAKIGAVYGKKSEEPLLTPRSRCLRHTTIRHVWANPRNSVAAPHSTVTDFVKFRGWSTSVPL